MRVSKRLNDADIGSVQFLTSCVVCRLPQVRTIEFSDGRYCGPCAVNEVALADQDTLDTVLPLIVEFRICAYCGEYGEELEHVVPRRTHLPTWTVYACRECNGLAGGRMFSCFAAKRDHIRKRLWRKYARFVRMPEWTEDEISALGDRMARHVRACSQLRDWIHARMAFEVTVEDLEEARLVRKSA